MRRLAEVLVFLGLALGLHLVLALRAPATGAQSGGAGGETLVTLQGAPEGLQELVRAWETPPDAELDPEAPVSAEPRSAPPVPRPRIEAAPPPVLPELQVAEASPDTVTVPKFDRQVPPPPPAPEALPQQVQALANRPRAAPEEPRPEPLAERMPTLAPPSSLRPPARPETAPKRDSPPPQPAPKPDPKPEARPAERTQQARSGGNGGTTQRAAGSGGAAQAGKAGKAQVVTGNGQQEARLQQVWGARIRTRIERRKRFPSGMRGQSGRVVVRLTVGRDGAILGASVLRSSGQQAFDAAAMEAVRRAGKLPPAPQGLGQASYSFTLPMDFS
ncbi:outer membrane transport energization protein TonB [Pseudooceanicola antarcticus]|uniref:Energy transducer TonB n=1 Tax=Pseudooceanicola antarcticus TaxID=1247613 RepID=A0A285IRC3_9RHOB|nr:energy transducer TonB [Pseudooceanicola antarcticus]PJE31853.1 energy transducer TonB [Pseudooceanicola antarcticus]SNY50575.1 outer membrane transport energization protein TonB [Pseudooceanicola antarcticus]